jgi:hypothetical protein
VPRRASGDVGQRPTRRLWGLGVMRDDGREYDVINLRSPGFWRFGAHPAHRGLRRPGCGLPACFPGLLEETRRERRPPLAPVPPHQPRPARDFARALEGGRVGAAANWMAASRTRLPSGTTSLPDPVIGDRSDTVLHAGTSVGLVMSLVVRIRRSPHLSGSPSGHINSRVVSYPKTPQVLSPTTPVGHRSIAATVLDLGPCRTPRRQCAGSAERRARASRPWSRHADQARQRSHVR